MSTPPAERVLAVAKKEEKIDELFPLSPADLSKSVVSRANVSPTDRRKM